LIAQKVTNKSLQDYDLYRNSPPVFINGFAASNLFAASGIFFCGSLRQIGSNGAKKLTQGIGIDLFYIPIKQKGKRRGGSRSLAGR
jgi:hypothetical protein